MTTKKWDPNEAERELLRARFTLWLNSLLARSSARHRRAFQKSQPEDVILISIEAFPEDFFSDPHNPYDRIESGNPDFDFEEGRLARAFAELPAMRKEVLRLLFVENKTPREIADILCCSEQFVSVQKQRALSKLRKVLGGEDL